MLNQGFFYFATTRNLITAFGQLFNSIVINRYSENGNAGTIVNTIKVPISYAPIDKILLQLQQKVEPPQLQSNNPNIPVQKTRIKMSLPRLSYMITNIQYDSARKLNTLGNTIGVNASNVGTYLSQLNPVPYDISFEVGIMVKNSADALQVLEQILPSFTPSFTINLKVIPELGLERDIPVIFAGVTQDDRFEGNMDESRVIIWRLQFVAKSMFYPVIKDAALIKTIHAAIFTNQQLTPPPAAVVTVEVEQDSNNMDVLDSNGNPIINNIITETDA